MTFRYPDKPAREIGRAHLDAMEAMGVYFCTLKLDGWRCIVRYDGDSFTYTSCSGKPLAVKEEVREGFEKAVRLECRAMGVVLDCELTGNRRAADAAHIFVLDVLGMGNETLYNYPAWERYGQAEDMFRDFVAKRARIRFSAFYDFHREHTPLAEGVVLKRNASIVIGSLTENAKNPGWVKCKWRAGESGISPT